jgi:hypothetical protein
MERNLFGQQIIKDVRYSDYEQKKEEKKKIKKEIQELQDTILEYNLYLDGKKSCILTKEQIQEDIKKMEFKIKVLKGIKVDDYFIIEECLEEGKKLMTEAVKDRQSQGKVRMSTKEIEEINKQAVKNVRVRYGIG